MPRVYLSPSTQEFNETVIGESEEYYMNLIADAMTPYLSASEIGYGRNSPDMTALSSVQQANNGDYGLYMAIHSNAASKENIGTSSGAEIFYYPGSRNGLRAAIITANNYKMIYPDPENIKIIPFGSLIELRRTKMPAILVEVGYHDNPKDALWIANNINEIGRNLALSVADYFNVPFVEPYERRSGIVTVQSGNLNVRSAPDTSSSIVGKLKDGAVVSVLERVPGWFFVTDGSVSGFSSAKYIRMLN